MIYDDALICSITKLDVQLTSIPNTHAQVYLWDGGRGWIHNIVHSLVYIFAQHNILIRSNI